MTATDTASAATGITEEQLTALVEGRWQDAPDNGKPGWNRDLDGDGEIVHQWLFPFNAPDDPGVRWSANSSGTHSGSRHVFVNSLDEALAWCDQRAGGSKPDEEGSATKQEEGFALLAERRG